MTTMEETMPLKLLLAPALALTSLWAHAVLAPHPADPGAAGSLYTVAQLRERLAANPRAWVGRVVRVRAIAYGCWALGGPGNAKCRIWRPSLIDRIGQADPLALSWAPPNPLLATLRQLPLVGDLLPPPQGTDWDVPAVYRVRIRVVAAGQCGAAACYQALLVDAAPDAPGEG
jgi:hypothetical protein